MKKIIFCCATFLFAIISCSEIAVGFLNYEFAVYKPGTFVIKNNLDGNIAEDAERIRREIHWVTAPIQGVEGTMPILYSFNCVKDSSGKDATKLFKDANVTVRGNGTIDVPYKHNLPIGEYKITLNVSNEGYSGVIPDILIVKVADL